MNIEAAVIKKITAARENPASARWVLMLVQQWESLAAVVLQVFHFYRRVGNARDSKPAHQYFAYCNVVMTGVIGKESRESTVWRKGRCEALIFQTDRRRLWWSPRPSLKGDWSRGRGIGGGRRCIGDGRRRAPPTGTGNWGRGRLLILKEISFPDVSVVSSGFNQVQADSRIIRGRRIGRGFLHRWRHCGSGWRLIHAIAEHDRQSEHSHQNR